MTLSSNRARRVCPTTSAAALLLSGAAAAQPPPAQPAAPPAEPAAPPAEPAASPKPPPPDAAPATAAPAEQPTAAPAQTAAQRPAPEPDTTVASASAGAAPTPAAPDGRSAAEPPTFDLSGSFFSRYELREGYAAQGLSHPRLHREGDLFVYRARLGIATRPVQLSERSAVSATFVPQASGIHATGEAPPTVGDAYNLGVHEAYIQLAGPRLRFQLGRFAMNYGDALVIGNLGWHEAARAFQGARLRYAAPSGANIDLFATLISEGQPATAETFDGDRYFYGVYAAIGPWLGELELDFYLLGQSAYTQEVDVSAPTDPAPDFETLDGATLFTFGSRVLQDLGVLDYRAEAGLQFGSAQAEPGDLALDKLAYQADAEVGVQPLEPLRLAVGGLVASGDDPATLDEDEGYDQLYPTGHKFLGLSDVFGGRTNALSLSGHASYRLAQPLLLKLDAHWLARLEENPAGETFTGTEVDAQLISPLGGGVVLRGLYAVFLANEDYWPQGDAMHYVEVQLGYDFQ